MIEGHSALRFAWQKKMAGRGGKRGFTHPANLITLAYNVVWWVPLILPFMDRISYRTGFIAFFVFTIFRLLANFYRNNVLRDARAEDFPLHV